MFADASERLRAWPESGRGEHLRCARKS